MVRTHRFSIALASLARGLRQATVPLAHPLVRGTEPSIQRPRPRNLRRRSALRNPLRGARIAPRGRPRVGSGDAPSALSAGSRAGGSAVVVSLPLLALLVLARLLAAGPVLAVLNVLRPPRW